MALDSENGPAQSYSAPQALAKAWATILIAHLGRLIGPNRCQPFIADQQPRAVFGRTKQPVHHASNPKSPFPISLIHRPQHRERTAERVWHSATRGLFTGACAHQRASTPPLSQSTAVLLRKIRAANDDKQRSQPLPRGAMAGVLQESEHV
jgi:hypothetical protein